MMSPDFMISGAAKNATTSLYHDLASHSGIFMIARKELDVLQVAGNTQEAKFLCIAHFFGAAGS